VCHKQNEADWQEGSRPALARAGDGVQGQRGGDGRPGRGELQPAPGTGEGAASSARMAAMATDGRELEREEGEWRMGGNAERAGVCEEHSLACPQRNR